MSQPVTAEFQPANDTGRRGRPMTWCSYIRLATEATWPRKARRQEPSAAERSFRSGGLGFHEWLRDCRSQDHNRVKGQRL